LFDNKFMPFGKIYPKRKTYKRKPRVTAKVSVKSTPMTRTKAINQNTKMIKSLKKVAYGGTFQRNFQIARMQGPPSFQFSKSQPIAFALNDFTSSTSTDSSGGQIFTPNYVAVTPGVYDTAASIIGNWATANPIGTQLTNNLSQKFKQWSDENQDQVSPEMYMPLSANYNLTFTRSTQTSAQAAVNIRIDVITTRRQFLKSQYHDYTMPECLGAFQNMAVSNDAGTRNSYNPTLWSVRTKYLKLPAIDTGVNVVRQNQSRSLQMFERFKPRNLKLRLDTVSASQKEPFHLAVDPDLIRWCVVSIGDDPATGANSGVIVKLQRTIRYRDLDQNP